MDDLCKEGEGTLLLASGAKRLKGKEEWYRGHGLKGSLRPPVSGEALPGSYSAGGGHPTLENDGPCPCRRGRGEARQRDCGAGEPDNDPCSLSLCEALSQKS